MAPRGIQNKDALKNNRLKRISKLKAQIAQLEKQGGTGKGSFRTKTKISQLKKILRDIGGGYQKTKTYKTEKKEVETSRGLKIRRLNLIQLLSHLLSHLLMDHLLMDHLLRLKTK